MVDDVVGGGEIVFGLLLLVVLAVVILIAIDILRWQLGLRDQRRRVRGFDVIPPNKP